MRQSTFATFFARYVEQCQRMGVEPVTAERAAELLADLGALHLSPAGHDEARGNGAGTPA